VKYRTIVADPPWPYNSSGDHLRATHDHRPGSWDAAANSAGSRVRYGAMGIPALCEMRPDHAADAHLYLWTTNSFMVEAHEIARAWGFTPKTILTWGKVTPDGTPSARAGYYYRGATEHVLFCVSGSLSLATKDVRPTLLLWPRLPHSVKPDAFFDMVEEASPGPYLELFARRQRTGWDTWGNECRRDIVMP